MGINNILYIIACIGDTTGLTNCSTVSSFAEFFTTFKYIIAVVVGWFLAQFLKYIIHSIKYKKANLTEILFTSGGMPSSHASVIVSVTTLIGLTDGINSALFGLASAVTLITVYDAVKSRKSVGDQAEVIGRLIKEQGAHVKPPKIVRGHKVSEVISGCALGIAVGIGIYLLTN